MSASDSRNEILSAAIRKLANKDIQAMDTIYDELSEELFAFICAKAENEDQIQNALEEILVLVYKYAGRFRKDMDPYKWIMNIANNLTNRKFKTETRLNKAIKGIKKAEAENTIDAADVLASVKTSCESITQDPETLDFVPQVPKNEIVLKHLAIVLIAILTFVIGFAIGKPNGPKMSKEVEATVYVDATSNYTLTVNEDELVLECATEDEFSEELLEGLDLKGLSLEDSLKYLSGAMYMNNELNGDDATILISVDAVDDESFDEAVKEVSKVFAEDNYDFSAVLQKVDTEELTDAAKRYEITIGKMGFVQLIIKSSDEFTGDNAQELSEKTIDELAVIYNTLVITDDEETSEEAEDKETSEEAEDDKKTEESSDSEKKDDSKADSNGIVVFIKDKAEEAKDTVTEKAEDAKDAVSEKANEAVEGAVEDAKDAVSDAVSDAANDVVNDIADQAGADEGTVSEIKTYIKKIIANIFG